MIFRRHRKSAVKLWRRLQRRAFDGRKILVLGDSHGGGLEYCFDRGLLAPHWLNCEIVGGATAYGLCNDQSATQAWRKFDRALYRFSDYDVVMIQLGECDCGYALWKKAAHLGVPPESLIDRSMGGIHRLVARIQDGTANRVRRIVLIGAILPTVDDSNILTQTSAMRREVVASQVARTHLVVKFNDALATLAKELGLSYFDLTEHILSPETGVVHPRFVIDAADHHLAPEATAALWSSALLKVL